jgi:hypothetical protein
MIANLTLLQRKYARVVNLFSEKTGIPLEEALSLFYNSWLYKAMSEGIADLHCRSDIYLADELILECRQPDAAEPETLYEPG